MPANVAMNGCTSKWWMAYPIPAPNSPPTTRTSGITNSGGQPCRWTRSAQSMVLSAPTAPTERSMPPVRITKVMPTAITSR